MTARVISELYYDSESKTVMNEALFLSKYFLVTFFLLLIYRFMSHEITSHTKNLHIYFEIPVVHVQKRFSDFHISY